MGIPKDNPAELEARLVAAMLRRIRDRWQPPPAIDDDPVQLWLTDLADLVLTDPEQPVPYRLAS